MHELAELARAAGFIRLSLSVDTGNPGRRLYERLSSETVRSDDGGTRMVYEVDDLIARTSQE